MLKKELRENSEELLVVSFLALMKKRFPELIIVNEGKKDYLERSLEFLQGYAEGHPDDVIVGDIFLICEIISRKINCEKKDFDFQRYLVEVKNLRRGCSLISSRIKKRGDDG